MGALSDIENETHMDDFARSSSMASRSCQDCYVCVGLLLVFSSLKLRGLPVKSSSALGQIP